MNEWLRHSHLEVSNLTEGSQETSKSIEAPDPLETTTFPIVYSESSVQGPQPEEGMVSQGGVKLEGEDNTDAQDALLTMDEIGWACAYLYNVTCGFRVIGMCQGH